MSGFQASVLGFRYGDHDEPALRDITMAINDGAVAWLTGAPGAGTSTLLLVAAGLAPTYTGGVVSGSCRLLDLDPGTPQGRAGLLGRVAFVSADPGSQLSGIAETVFEEVAFAPANLGWSRDRIQDAVRSALERVGISHLASRGPASLSGGEQQRVVIASMLALSPDAWLLDEPGSALDARGKESLAQLLIAEAGRGALVMVASEDADWLAGWATRLVVMQHGHIARDGTPVELLADPTLSDTGAGSTAAAAMAQALARRDPSFSSKTYPTTIAAAVERWR